MLLPRTVVHFFPLHEGSFLARTKKMSGQEILPVLHTKPNTSLPRDIVGHCGQTHRTWGSPARMELLQGPRSLVILLIVIMGRGTHLALISPELYVAETWKVA